MQIMVFKWSSSSHTHTGRHTMNCPSIVETFHKWKTQQQQRKWQWDYFTRIQNPRKMSQKISKGDDASNCQWHKIKQKTTLSPYRRRWLSASFFTPSYWKRVPLTIYFFSFVCFGSIYNDSFVKKKCMHVFTDAYHTFTFRALKHPPHNWMASISMTRTNNIDMKQMIVLGRNLWTKINVSLCINFESL